MMPSPDFLLLPLFYTWSGFAFCLTAIAVHYVLALNAHRRSKGQSSVSRTQAGCARIALYVIGVGGILGFARLSGFARGMGLLDGYESYCALGMLAGAALAIYIACQVHKWLPASSNEG
jgi:hypothetical protein